MKMDSTREEIKVCVYGDTSTVLYEGKVISTRSTDRV